MKRFPKLHYRLFQRTFPLLVLGCLLIACSTQPTPGSETATPEALPTATRELSTQPVSTPTKTPLPPLVILLAGPESDPGLTSMLQAQVAELASERGFRWQVRQSISLVETSAEVAFLIALPPSPDLAALVAGAPDTRFLVIGFPNLQPAENLILITGDEYSPAQAAFIAGYIAALITPESRIGIITTDDDSKTIHFSGYENGMRFYCGLCRPQFAPFYAYPFLTSLPIDASDAQWQALGDFMVDRFVRTVYISPGAENSVMLESLARAEVLLIGSSNPPESLQANWVASLRTDPTGAYLNYLPRLLAGETGITETLPLLLTDINPNLLSPGRQRLVEETMVELMAGFIDPLLGEASE